VLDRHLLGLGDGDGVAVVLAEEDDREAVDPGEVAALVEIAFGGGALAEAGDRHLAGAAELGGVGHAGRLRDLGGNDAGGRDDPVLGGAVVGGHLAAAGEGVALLGQHAEHDILGTEAEGKAEGEIAVVGEQDIALAVEGKGRSDQGRLVPLS
jgi:hypothetical protein